MVTLVLQELLQGKYSARITQNLFRKLRQIALEVQKKLVQINGEKVASYWRRTVAHYSRFLKLEDV